MANASSTNVKLADCPVCQTDIMMRVTFQFSRDDVDLNGKALNLRGEATGAYVNHDCTPKAVR